MQDGHCFRILRKYFLKGWITLGVEKLRSGIIHQNERYGDRVLGRINQLPKGIPQPIRDFCGQLANPFSQRNRK
jgi:hypothetical protein